MIGKWSINNAIVPESFREFVLNLAIFKMSSAKDNFDNVCYKKTGPLDLTAPPKLKTVEIKLPSYRSS